MRILGAQPTEILNSLSQESGYLWGKNDLFLGKLENVRVMIQSPLCSSDKVVTRQPKTYLHIVRGLWSSITAFLRQHLLFWRWQVVYLDSEDGRQPRKALLCTDIYNGRLPNDLDKVLGRDLLAASLIDTNQYTEVFDYEHLRIPAAGEAKTNKIVHPLGEWYGLYLEGPTNEKLCPIYRARGIISSVNYQFLKNVSNRWEEVTLKSKHTSEVVLIHKTDKESIAKAGLLG